MIPSHAWLTVFFAVTAIFSPRVLTAAAPLATVPFRWTPGQIEIEVSVNGGAPVWFILDSGAEYSILDEPLARRLRLTSHARLGRAFVTGVSLRLGSAELKDQDVMVFALENFRRQGRSIAGVIGYDFFQRYVVAIDYSARTLSLYEPRTYPAPPTATSIPLSFAGRLVTVPVTIAPADTTPIQARVILDTGAAQTLILRHPFAEAHGLLQRAATHATTRAGSLETVTVTFARLPVREVKLGAFTFRDPVLRLYTSPSGAGGDTETDGALGNEILRRFTATFDYSRQRLLLQSNSSFGDSMR